MLRFYSLLILTVFLQPVLGTPPIKPQKSSCQESLIAPGTGPADLSRILRQLNFIDRQMSISIKTETPIDALIARRSYYLQELAEFHALAKDFKESIRIYNQVADDLKFLYKNGKLDSTTEKLRYLLAIKQSGQLHSSESQDPLEHSDYFFVLSEVADELPSKSFSEGISAIRNLHFDTLSRNTNIITENEKSIWGATQSYWKAIIKFEIMIVLTKNFEDRGFVELSEHPDWKAQQISVMNALAELHQRIQTQFPYWTQEKKFEFLKSIITFRSLSQSI